MRKLTGSLFTIGALVSIFLASCSSGLQSEVSVQFHGYHLAPIVVEQTMPGSNPKVLDTLRTGSDGVFSFIVNFEDENPLFVNIRTTDNYVPLLLAPGEKVKVSSIGNLYNNYEVSGSKGSEELHALNMTTVAQIKSLDSLSRLLQSGVQDARLKELSRQYTQEYINLKRNVIRFVITNPTSMASIVPLYQPMVAGRYIFDEPTDIVYFRTISDSLSKRYPTSPYVVSLRADVDQSNSVLVMDSTINQALSEVQEVALPPLEMKDAEGQLRKLSELIGNKVVLLDFTSLLASEMKLRNRELMQVYDQYSDKGFEIYQVSLDNSRADWLKAVVDARLKWISVNDFQGVNSSALAVFNIQNLPSNYLIDLNGEIVAKDLMTHHDLEAALSKIIK